MAFNRLSTVACPFSPKCILSKGFFFWLFFRIFAPLILERTHGKLWIRHIWSCEIEKKGHSRKEDEEEKKKMRMMVCLVELFSQCTFMYKTTTSRNLIFGFETCPFHSGLQNGGNSAITTELPATCYLLVSETEPNFFGNTANRKEQYFISF